MRILAVVALAASCGGCASITRGTMEMISFDSQPSGAEVRTSLGLACITPCTLNVPRKEEFTATFTKPGFEREDVFVKTQIAGAGAAGFAGNLVFGGVVGMGVDAYTGATMEHTPNPVQVVLKPVMAPPPPVAIRPPPRKKIDPATLTQ
jgi:hypothetical protein